MKHPTRVLFLLAAVTTIGCADGDPVAPLMTADVHAAASEGALAPSFMSRNLYIGTDINPVVAALASPGQSDDVPALIAAIAAIQATNWPARVVALADEIARERPQVIGLQEVWSININLTPLGLALVVNQDFLANLQAELSSRGLHYAVAGTVSAVTANPFPGINVFDRDVILIDPTRVTVTPGSVVAQTFAANIGTIAPGVIVRRGWVAFSGTVDGVPMTIANTHLESERSPQLSTLRSYQAGQLVASLGTASPVVLLGDFNDEAGSPMHNVVTSAGFVDTWTAMRPGVTGLTCCHAKDLSNALASEAFNQRIDYAFVRGLTHANGTLLGQIKLIGASPSDRLFGPTSVIWPSDHAGLSVKLLLPGQH